MLLYVISAVALTTLFVLYRRHRSGQLVSDMGTKAVMVTGCDSGFGKALVLRLDAMGVTVFAGSLSDQGVQALKENTSNRLTAFRLDVTSSQSIRSAFLIVKETIAKLGDHTKLWAVVNNAGILGDFGTTEMHTRLDYQHVMEVNFFGQVDMVHQFLPLLKESHGRIINVASMAGFYPYGTLNFPAPYTPSKYAVIGYTEALRHDMMKWGISVSYVAPGGHRTKLMSVQGQLVRFRALWQRLPASVRQEYGQSWIDTVCENYSKLDTFIESLPGPDPVVDAFAHALFSTRPKPRYLVGGDAVAVNLLKHLPYCLIDRLARGPLSIMDIPLPEVLVKGRNPLDVDDAQSNGIVNDKAPPVSNSLLANNVCY